MRMWVRSLASLNGLRIWRRYGWWYRLAVTALIRSLAWDFHMAWVWPLKKGGGLSLISGKLAPNHVFHILWQLENLKCLKDRPYDDVQKEDLLPIQVPTTVFKRVRSALLKLIDLHC